jgi:hypothetical protein
VAGVAVLAVLFAPTTGQGPEGPIGTAREPAETRTLAPTLREAVLAVPSDLRVWHLRAGERRAPPETVLPTAASIAVAVLLMWLAVGVGAVLVGGTHLLALLKSVPRGPPRLQAV